MTSPQGPPSPLMRWVVPIGIVTFGLVLGVIGIVARLPFLLFGVAGALLLWIVLAVLVLLVNRSRLRGTFARTGATTGFVSVIRPREAEGVRAAFAAPSVGLGNVVVTADDAALSLQMTGQTVATLPWHAIESLDAAWSGALPAVEVRSEHGTALLPVWSGFGPFFPASDARIELGALKAARNSSPGP